VDDLSMRVTGLGKQFRIGERSGSYRTFRDAITSAASAPLRRLGSGGNGSPPGYFWALKDVSFDVRKGEVLGIIGRNGAGKSTLLKILSRITEPTAGRAEIYGRVGSLLEVGTGFHPELTGRENIFLSGAILGMKRSEIESKFDEIVKFAETERFLDMQLKHYSSGMQVRLGFAVAAHLEPEILIIDEVLAVGDAEFQKKCLGKMKDVAREGRTVLFVSHNMPAVMNMCTRVILMGAGKVVEDGKTGDVIQDYLSLIDNITMVPLSERTDRKGNQAMRFTSFGLTGRDGRNVNTIYSGDSLGIRLKYRSGKASSLKNVHVSIGVHGTYDENLFCLSTTVNDQDYPELPSEGAIMCNIPRLPLQPGKYNITIFSTVNGVIADWIQNAGTIDVEAGNFFNTGKLPPVEQGPFLVDQLWSVTGD
jgi:lipopolysaccharide transport system ATP-binding protein